MKHPLAGTPLNMLVEYEMSTPESIRNDAKMEPIYK